MRRIWNIITVALVAALSASCHKEVEEDVPAQLISYNVSMDMSTKGTSDFPTDKPFFTYAYYLPGTATWASEAQSWAGEAIGASASVYIERETVTESGGAWGIASRPYYWPQVGSLTFFSYVHLSGMNVALTKNGFQFDWNIAGRTENIEANDILVADVAMDKTYNSSKDEWGDNMFTSNAPGVPTIFRHKLSKVAFHVHVPSYIDIQSITLENVYCQATYSQDLGKNDVWDGHDVNNDNFPVTSGISYMMIPQNLKNGPKTEVRIRYRVAGSDTDFEGVVELEDTWEIGRCYNYYITLQEYNILDILLQISKWNEVTSNIIL